MFWLQLKFGRSLDVSSVLSAAANMRILFLTHYYPPEVNAPAIRVSELAREWTLAGNEVIVVTGAPNHPHEKLYPSYRNRVFQREKLNRVQVIRVWTYLASNEGFFHRILNYLSCFISASAQVMRLPTADVVISTSPQFFCVTVGAIRRSAVIRLVEKIESWAYRTADHVVSVTNSFVSHLTERGAERSNISVITNSVDLNAFNNPGDGQDFRAMYGLQGRFVASYVGTHGMAHRLETILEAAELTRDYPHIAYVMVGAGPDRDRLMASKAQKGHHLRSGQSKAAVRMMSA